MSIHAAFFSCYPILEVFANSILDAPARIKKELDTVLNLQAEIMEIEKHLNDVQIMVSKDTANDAAVEFVDSLKRSHTRTVDRVEKLYASLNISNNHPELTGLSLDFVRTLLMARDLKMNIRKRAIGSFFEWDKLDRAAGGRDEALGKLAEFVFSKRLGLDTELQAPSYISKLARLLQNAHPR